MPVRHSGWRPRSAGGRPSRGARGARGVEAGQGRAAEIHQNVGGANGVVGVLPIVFRTAGERIVACKERVESEVHEQGYYVAGTRVSLDSLVHAFRRGEAPETICQNFEILLLEEVYGAIAYYLANQAAMDAYLVSQGEKWTEGKRNSESLSANLRERLTRAREERHASSPS